MTKFRFPGRTTKNATNRTRVPGVRQGTDEAAITAEKIHLVYKVWQHLFENNSDEGFQGFTKQEAQQAVSSAIDIANENNLESLTFVERLQEIEEEQEQRAQQLASTPRRKKLASDSASKATNNLLRKSAFPSKTGSRAMPPNTKCPDNKVIDNETEYSTQKYGTNVKFEPDFKIKKDKLCESQRLSKSEKRLCKISSNTPNHKRFKSSPETSPKNSSIILKPSTLKFESFSSGYILGSSWIQSTTPTVKPTSLPDSKCCIICERMTSHPDVQCDWCRSFMEEMTCMTTRKVICFRGRGTCKITNTDVKARCSACWLACCLSKLPVAQKTLARLKKCLPTSLQYQIGAGIPVKKDPLRGWSDNIANQTQLAARALMKKATKTVNNKNKVFEIVDASKKKHKLKDKPKRQKMHLKGPRIKHVCRSASVVLGQPQAIFPVSPDSKSSDGMSRKSKDVISEGKSKAERKAAKMAAEARPPTPLILPPDLLGLPVPPPSKSDIPPGWICLDFEPAEGSCVPVISSAGASALPSALCLLCGSAGKEEMLFCAMCCEPYHIYCLDVTPQLNKMWICERCELCCECKNPTLHHSEVMRCHKCAAPYHKHCLTVKPSQRPWECPTCNVCRSCGAAANNMRHVGNTAFCAPCYKLRLKGNFCPLCQQCYKDDDYDTKMVECAECLSWVHARCERISDEKYEILSYLPESVEFHCQNCCTQSPAPWQIAVENEIKNGVTNIVKNLAKYRSIKVTPHKVDKSADKENLMEEEVSSSETSKSETGNDKTCVPSKASDKPEVVQSTSQATETSSAKEDNPNQSQMSVNNHEFAKQSDRVDVTEPNSKVVEIKVPQPNEKSKSETIQQCTAKNADSSSLSGALKENNASDVNTKRDPKIEAAKVKLDFSEENMKFPRLVVRLTDYTKHKPKATQTLKLKQICDAYNIKECSVHLRKCNVDKVQIPEKENSDSASTSNNIEKQDEAAVSSTPAQNSQVTEQPSIPAQEPVITSPSFKAPDKNANYDMKVVEPAVEAPRTRSRGKQITSEPPGKEALDKVSTELPAPQPTISAFSSEPESATMEKKSPEIVKPTTPVKDGTSQTMEVKQEVQPEAVVKESISMPVSEKKSQIVPNIEPRLLDSPRTKGSDSQHLDVRQMAATLRKANLGFYDSLLAFDLEFQNEILKYKSSEFKEQYLKLLTETFPWYKPGEQTKVSTETEVVPKIEPGANKVHDRSFGSVKQESDKTWSQMFLPEYADVRACALCKGFSDRDVMGGERLLHTGLAPPLDWVHASCALWSSEVWEDRDGLLHSLAPAAVTRANRTKCALCGEKGASVGCCHSSSCPNSYHWPCALAMLVPREVDGKQIWLDQADMSLFCSDHFAQHVAELDGETPEYNFALPRKLKIESGRVKKRYCDPEKVQVSVGSLRVERLGLLNSVLCHDEARDILVPDGYTARRLFWSTKEPWKIVEYLMFTELEPEYSLDEGLARDINMTVEHGTHGAPQEVMEKNLRMLRHIQQQEIDLGRDPELNSKENADDLLLPPDLKETIFQDLNSELLDGISMQDIFTKLLSEDAIKEEVLSDSEEPSLLCNPIRECIDNIVDQVCLMESLEPRPRKRNLRHSSESSDEESFENGYKFAKSSCGNNFEELVRLKCIPQLDGADDSSGSDSESLTKSDEMKVEVETSLTRKIKERSLAASEPCNEGPVRCEICKRTYRTKTGYDRHLSSCTEVSSDSSDESTEIPTTSRMTAKTSKYGTVVLTTKVVLVQSPEKNNQKRKAAKSNRKAVKLAAKPPPTPILSQPSETPQPVAPIQHIATIEAPSQFNQNIVFQDQSMLMGQNPIFLTPQPSNTVYYITLTPPSKQNIIYMNNAESPGHQVMYMQAPDQDSMTQNPIIMQPSTQYGNMVTLNPSYNPGQVTPGYCQSSINTTFIPAVNQNITYSPTQQAFTQAFNPTESSVQPIANPIISSNTGGIFLSSNGQAFTVNPTGHHNLNQTFITTAMNPTLNTLPASLNLNAAQEGPVQVMSADKLQEPTFMVHAPAVPQTPRQQTSAENLPPTHHTPTREGLLMNPTILTNAGMLKTNGRQENIMINPNMISMSKEQPATVMNNVQVPQNPITVNSMTNHVNVSPSYSIQNSDLGMSCMNPQVPSSPLHLQNIHHMPTTPQHVMANQANHISAQHMVHHHMSSQQNMLPLNSYYPTATNHVHSTMQSQQQGHQTFYQPPMHVGGAQNSHQVQMRPNYNYVPRPQQNHGLHNGVMKHNTSVNKTTHYKRSTNASMAHHHMHSGSTRCRMPQTNTTVATATRLYVQPPIKTYSSAQNAKNIKPPVVTLAPSPSVNAPPAEAKVVKITASASVGTQTTLRCATPSSIKKEPVDFEDKTGIKVKIQSSDGFVTTANSVSQAWLNIVDAVQIARQSFNLSPLPFNALHHLGQHMSGLSHDSVRYLLEQLPGVNKCNNYVPKFHNSSEKDRLKAKLVEPKLNPSGCARTEPFKTRNPYDMFGWLASAHRKPPQIKSTEIEAISRRASNSLPMAMRFRQLKNKVKVKVGVFRSPIHGRGLFCLRELEAAEMVIEYAGEVIRSALTDKREKIYESRGIGCYMFRIDDYIVVDATMKGNAARFINHSCEPNCYSRVVDVLGKKHILIFALRRILPGEELTYDYKFPFEDDKIPCTCGSRKCRKYLN